ncbi:MAG: hypothetical protein K0R84_393 [Clostridia bacterium]|jgi:hypothetical protein|nr:hypothetical protein [Clostridia bacterium]
MKKRNLILALSVILVVAAAFLYFNKINKTVDSGSETVNEDNLLRNAVIEIETNMALTHAMEMTWDELVNQTEPHIYSYYKETFFSELKRAYETRNLVPYILDNGPPYYQYISKVYSSDDNSIKRIFTKSSEISAIDLSTQMPVEGTRSQVAKMYIFKKENEQWKVVSVNNYLLSIDRNEPKKIIEKFANYNDIPIEYEYVKIPE